MEANIRMMSDQLFQDHHEVDLASPCIYGEGDDVVWEAKLVVEDVTGGAKKLEVLVGGPLLEGKDKALFGEEFGVKLIGGD
jgi:hypothetical protein